MKPRPLLFTAEPEALGGNGPSAVIETPAAVAAAEAPAAEVAAEPTFLQRASAAFSSKAALISERDTFRLRAETAEAENATLHSSLSTLNSQLSTLQTERQQLSALLDTAAAEKQDIDTAAAVQVAQLGFESAALPAATAAEPETLESLNAQLATAQAARDHTKVWELAEKIDALNN